MKNETKLIIFFCVLLAVSSGLFYAVGASNRESDRPSPQPSPVPHITPPPAATAEPSTPKPEPSPTPTATPTPTPEPSATPSPTPKPEPSPTATPSQSVLWMNDTRRALWATWKQVHAGDPQPILAPTPDPLLRIEVGDQLLELGARADGTVVWKKFEE